MWKLEILEKTQCQSIDILDAIDCMHLFMEKLSMKINFHVGAIYCSVIFLENFDMEIDCKSESIDYKNS